MAMAWQGENKHYLWDKIQLRHIFNTAKLAGLAKEVVEEILHEISVRYPKVSEINTHGLPEEIVEPISMGLESKMKKIVRKSGADHFAPLFDFIVEVDPLIQGFYR